jgi:hypothetical protein
MKSLKKYTKKKSYKKKNKKTRYNRQKGGKCYGNGVGANSNDINYSIFNTNLLKLFPYNPK